LIALSISGASRFVEGDPREARNPATAAEYDDNAPQPAAAMKSQPLS
jgi:hypothetical protein